MYKVTIPEYNSLYDWHLKAFYEECALSAFFLISLLFCLSSPKMQKYFITHGLIDKDGRIIDYEKNKAKMLIIEQEFKFVFIISG